MAVADRNAPGIAEYIRMRSMEVTKRAMLGRGVSVIRKGTLIVNLPGSPKAVRESLEFVTDTLAHGLKVLRGSVNECGRLLKKQDEPGTAETYSKYTENTSVKE